MICVPAPPALMAFREDWNRANGTSLGADWRMDYDLMQINTNRIEKNIVGFTTRVGAWASYMGASTGLYNGGRLLTDNWAVEGQCIAPAGGGAATDNGTSLSGAIYDNGPGTGITFVYAIFSLATVSPAAAIMTQNGAIASPGTGAPAITGQTQRAVTASGIAATDLMRFERRMYSATQSVFTLYKNGVSYLTWDDSGAVVPAGPTSRRWGIQNEGNFPIFQQAFFSPALDWVRAYDLKA